MLAHHELCIDDMIDVYSDSVSDEEYLNIDVLVDKIVLHSDIYEDSNSRCSSPLVGLQELTKRIDVVSHTRY